MLRSLLVEFGIIIAWGAGRAGKYAKGILDRDKSTLPEVAIDVLKQLNQQLAVMHLRLRWYEMRMRLHSKLEKRVMLLRAIPGDEPVMASAIIATVGDAKQFKNGRQFAAWLGLTPLNQSSGGKERLGQIMKMCDRYIRRLLVTGMTARLRQVKVNPDRVDPWAIDLLMRKPSRLVTVAMANKTARIIWAVLTKNEYYRPHTA